MSLYTPFSNYKEVNQEQREKAAENIASLWGDREPEYRKYRDDWNKASNDPDYIPEIPLCVTIDASSACNFRCQGCHQSVDDNMGQLGQLSWDRAIKIIDQCIDLKVPSVSFTQRGEPTLNKHLPEMIERCVKGGILDTRIVTNAQSPHKDMLIKLAESGIHFLIISLDGMSPESFETYRRGSNFYTIMKNVFTILEWKRKHKSSFPVLRVQCVRTKYNEHEIDDFLKFWSAIPEIDDVRVSDITNREYGKKEVSTLFAGDQVSTARKLCPQPRVRLVFTDKADNAYPCCHDWREAYPMGNIDNESLLDIWNGAPLEALREIHKKGKHDSVDMCRGCGEKASYIWEKKS